MYRQRFYRYIYHLCMYMLYTNIVCTRVHAFILLTSVGGCARTDPVEVDVNEIRIKLTGVCVSLYIRRSRCCRDYAGTRLSTVAAGNKKLIDGNL